MFKVAVVSLGCPKNLVDSENMLALINQAHIQISSNPADAHVIIINTCGFISSAKEESINTILEMAQYKKEGTCRLLIVVGCLVQKHRKEIEMEIPEIDVLLGTDSYHRIVEVINHTLEGQFDNTECLIPVAEHLELPRNLTTPKHYAYLRIAEGCDNYCTFCSIPQIRGGYRSRTIENIVNEAKQLVSDGVKELILVAQDTTQYGKDLYGEFMLVELLRELVKIDELRWIRLLYCYPNHFSEQLIKIIAKETKICKYIDLPLQHADDTILKKMGRRITQEQIRNLLIKIRKEIPQIIIRSTFIVGFPGETKENFNSLINFLREARLDRVGAFTYSQEEDTPAGKLPDQVNEKTKLNRLKKLMALQYQILSEKNRAYIGHNLIVQVEGATDENPNLWICRSQGEAPEIDPVILLYSEDRLIPGQLHSVKITHIQDYDLIGEINSEST
ncbi:MAG: 30S ribosomal protein S12 methylthiotransferase RimO [Bacillota bacterium]